MSKFTQFPPFYTLQPHPETQATQLEIWKQVLVDYCRENKIYLWTIDKDEIPFRNNAIDRSIQESLLKKLIELMISEKLFERIPNNRGFIVWWKSPKQWADLLHEAYENEMVTAYEIFYQEDSKFYAIPEAVYTQILAVLHDEGRITILKSANSKEMGIKFA